jgi:hypothetical protein
MPEITTVNTEPPATTRGVPEPSVNTTDDPDTETVEAGLPAITVEVS